MLETLPDPLSHNPPHQHPHSHSHLRPPLPPVSLRQTGMPGPHIIPRGYSSEGGSLHPALAGLTAAASWRTDPAGGDSPLPSIHDVLQPPRPSQEDEPVHLHGSPTRSFVLHNGPPPPRRTTLPSGGISQHGTRICAIEDGYSARMVDILICK